MNTNAHGSQYNRQKLLNGSHNQTMTNRHRYVLASAIQRKAGYSRVNMSYQGKSRNHSYNVDSQLPNDTRRTKYAVYGEPVRHIAFIKVHKAASTTVQNIFLRYGYEHNLVFALPKRGSIISKRKSIRTDNILAPPKNRSYDIMCSHARFNKEACQKILPTDTIYIGIVREPFGQFQSNLQYFRPRDVLNIPGNKPVLEYLLHNDMYMKEGQPIPSTYNSMAYDFGFPDDLFWSNDRTGIQNYLLKLERDVDLVIVTDYFEESVVLMRRLLHWDLKYVLYGKLNAKNKRHPRLQIGTDEEKLYKSWARLDYALYYFFLEKLLENLQQQPPDFYEELAYFKQIRSKYDTFCLSVINDDIGSTELWFAGSAWNKPFVITKGNCKMLHIREIPFLDKLRARQRLR